MRVDGLLLFSQAQSVTTGSGSASTPGVVSSNIIDLGAERRIGTGKPLYVVAVCTVAMTSSGSNDALDVNLYSDTDSAFGSPTFRQKLFTFPAVSAIGTKLIAAINPDVLNERYIGLYYLSQTTDALTAGTFTAFITSTPDAYRSYSDAVTIS